MRHRRPVRAGAVLLAVPALSLLAQRTGTFGLDSGISRRALLRLGGLGLAILGTAGWRPRTQTRTRTGAGRAASCILTPEQTAGPYYIPREKVRANITEHRPGTPLTLRLTVVDAATCQPLQGAAVDVWHCDAAGVYSGFESASVDGPPRAPGGAAGPTDKNTFLRGIQRTDARGACAFRTIYPGWYRGRTVHIHVTVHVGGTVVHTGQLYFPDRLTDQVYQREPYKRRAAARDTRNNTDSIYRSGGPQSMLAMKHAGAGYTGTIILGVRRL